MEEKLNNLVRLRDILKIYSVWVDRNKKFYGISKIVFYNEKGIIFSSNSNFDGIENFKFKGEIFRKIKEDFTKIQNFVMKNDNDSIWDNNNTLYINEKNVDLKYLGQRKKWSYVYDIYNVNGVEFEIFNKSLDFKLCEYKDLLKTEIKKINDNYIYPFKEKELKEIFENILKYNKLIIEEKKNIENFKVDKEV